MRHPEPDNIKNMESQPPANLNFWIRELPKTVPKKLPKKKTTTTLIMSGAHGTKNAAFLVSTAFLAADPQLKIKLKITF
jgi:hypothetical protein